MIASPWPDASTLALFALAVLVLNATPGVDLLLTVQRTLAGGRRAGAAAALGICAGCIVHVTAAASGLAALLAVSAGAFGALKALGAAYLLWLAWGMARAAWRPPPASPGAADGAAMAPPPSSWRAEFARGFATNVLNPKVALFFVAFLPPFVPAHAARPALSFALLGAWLIVQSLTFLLAVVATVDRAAQAVRRSGATRAWARAWGRALHGVGAALFAGLAWRLATSRQP